MDAMTLREKWTCDKCHEVHTNDALELTHDPAQGGKVVARVCAFCEYNVDKWAANGTPTRYDKKRTVTREEDRLEAEEDLHG